MCEQIGLVEGVTGVIQGIVVVENDFGEISSANMFVVSFFVRCSKNQYEFFLVV